jgi:hypothetical protein
MSLSSVGFTSFVVDTMCTDFITKAVEAADDSVFRFWQEQYEMSMDAREFLDASLMCIAVLAEHVL